MESEDEGYQNTMTIQSTYDVEKQLDKMIQLGQLRIQGGETKNNDSEHLNNETELADLLSAMSTETKKFRYLLQLLHDNQESNELTKPSESLSLSRDRSTLHINDDYGDTHQRKSRCRSKLKSSDNKINYQVRTEDSDRIMNYIKRPRDSFDKIVYRLKRIQGLQDTGANSVNKQEEKLICDMILLCVVSSACMQYFSKINRTGALSLYKEVYAKTLNNIENLFNTDKNNSLAKFLVEETPYLNNRKIVNFVRDTEFVDALGIESILDHLDTAFNGGFYDAQDLSFTNWRFWLSFLSFGILAGFVYKTTNKNTTDWSIFWHDIFNLHVDKVNVIPKTQQINIQRSHNGKSSTDSASNKEASHMDKWRNFMTARKVKNFYKASADFMTFIVLCLYSLLGQTFKLKEFDFMLYYIIFHIMFSLFRQVFFFATYDKYPKESVNDFQQSGKSQKSQQSTISTISDISTSSKKSTLPKNQYGRTHRHFKDTKDTWCVMRFEIFAFMNLIQFLVLIIVMMTRLLYVLHTPEFVATPTVTFAEDGLKPPGQFEFVFAQNGSETYNKSLFWSAVENRPVGIDRLSFTNSDAYSSDFKNDMPNIQYVNKLYRDPENGELLDVQIQRAPKNFNARARIFYFIYHPEKVTSTNMFDTKLSPDEMEKSCPALKKFPPEYWHRSCCWESDEGKFKQQLSVEDHFGEGKIFENKIGKWLLHYGPQYKGEVPLCIHQDIESLGNVNLIITNIFVLVVGVMFLRHFRHSQTLGKMVFSIFHCIKSFLSWALISLFIIFPYGIFQFNLLRPNNILRTLEDKYEIKNDTIIRTDKSVYTSDAEVLLQLFKSAFFNLFGELFYEEFDETAHDPSTCTNTLSSENGEKCTDYNIFSIIILGVYMTMMTLIFLNILIAIFNQAWEDINKNASIHQAILYYDVIVEESYNLPFGYLNPIAQMLLILWAVLTTLFVSITSCCISKYKNCTSDSNSSRTESIKVFFQLKLFPRMPQYDDGDIDDQISDIK